MVLRFYCCLLAKTCIGKKLYGEGKTTLRTNSLIKKNKNKETPYNTKKTAILHLNVHANPHWPFQTQLGKRLHSGVHGRTEEQRLPPLLGARTHAHQLLHLMKTHAKGGLVIGWFHWGWW